MAARRKSESDAFEAIHSAVSGTYRAGTISKAIMRRFDALCLAKPAPQKPREIKRIRKSQRVSQRIHGRKMGGGAK